MINLRIASRKLCSGRQAGLGHVRWTWRSLSGHNQA